MPNHATYTAASDISPPKKQNTELTQVPGVCVHVVGDGYDGHCLLHRRLRLDHGARHRHAFGVQTFFKLKTHILS
jgi:hypothetical protein